MTQYTMVAKKGVLADVDKNGKDDFIDGLDFNTISSVFDAYKPNAPKLSVKNGTYLIIDRRDRLPGRRDARWRAGTGPALPRARPRDGHRHEGLERRSTSGRISWSRRDEDVGRERPRGWYDATTNQPKFAARRRRPVVATSRQVDWSHGCAAATSTGTASRSRRTGEWVTTGFAATLYAADDPAFVDFDGDGNVD